MRSIITSGFFLQRWLLSLAAISIKQYRSFKITTSIAAISLCPFFLLPCHAQSKISVEQYSFMGANQASLLAPVAHYETTKKWYAEARYNYEDINTISVYAGRTFSGEKNIAWSLTPMIGGIAGKMKGGSFGLNSECSFKKFYFSSQAQYSVSAQTRLDNFFYNWSELYYAPLEWIYTGIAVQHTRIYASNALVDPGVLVGFSFNQWSFPVYGFNPFATDRYFVVGVNWEWKHAGNKRKRIEPPIVSGRDEKPMQ